MRVSLVTETYYPQVNGVSRTLGELVRHLTERGDPVQLIHPNYGEPAGRPDVHLVRSVNVPFYKQRPKTGLELNRAVLYSVAWHSIRHRCPLERHGGRYDAPPLASRHRLQTLGT